MTQLLRKIYTFILLMFFLSSSQLVFSEGNTSSGNDYQKIDKIIATVGQDIIFSSELERRLLQAKLRLNLSGKPIDEEQLRQQLLNLLVLEKLKLSVADRANLVVGDKEIDVALSRTRRNIERGGTSFKKYLSDNKLTVDLLRQEIKNEIAIDKIQQAVIEQRVDITEREIDTFLDSPEGLAWLTPKYQLQHILLSQKSNKLANSIYNTLKKNPKKFSSLAQKYSKGPNANKGGDLGLKTEETLPTLFIQQANTVELGEVTKPFNSNAGIHILRLVNRLGAEPVIVDQYLVRHILVSVNDLFVDEEAKVKANRLYIDLQNGTDFVELAKQETDDIGTKQNGGDLGWSNLGRFVPEFEKVMLNTPINTISAPFKTEFGWHILRVEGKRTEDVFDSVKRQQAKKFLIRQRFNDELQLWHQELLNTTHVKVLI